MPVESRPFTVELHFELWAPSKEAALAVARDIVEDIFQHEAVGALSYDAPAEGELKVEE